MDTPPRTAILQEIASRLGANQGTEQEPEYLTPAGPRNEVAYALPVHRGIMPINLVYDDEESHAGWVGGLEKRRLEIQIEFHALAATAEALDALLDLGAWAAEAVVLADPRLGGLLAEDIEFERCIKQREDKGQDGFYGTALLFFKAVYLRPELDLSSLDDFKHFHGEYDMAPPDGAIDATDEVELPGPED